MIRIFLAVMAAFVLCSCNNTGESKTISSVTGEQLFKINCEQCHRPTEDFIGPALQHVTIRWKDKTLLYQFIKNSQDVIVRDAYAKELFSKWKQAYMQPFPDLSHEEIDKILSYCDNVR